MERFCEKCKNELEREKAFCVNGVWYCDKCAGRCDCCGQTALADNLVGKICIDCVNITDEYEMESFNEIF